MRQDAAKKEKAWEKAGEKVGVQIWRIEKFKVKHWPKDRYGEFYSGDSYIILHTMEDDEGKKSYDLHFWLGSDTTQDEVSIVFYYLLYCIVLYLFVCCLVRLVLQHTRQ